LHIVEIKLGFVKENAPKKVTPSAFYEKNQIFFNKSRAQKGKHAIKKFTNITHKQLKIKFPFCYTLTRFENAHKKSRAQRGHRLYTFMGSKQKALKIPRR